ncbi:MAG: hypothetical protein J5803_04405 [Desulfovibrio sp.]|nr:hypothetical protein [Desulfovibrio sp.]
MSDSHYETVQALLALYGYRRAVLHDRLCRGTIPPAAPSDDSQMIAACARTLKNTQQQENKAFHFH